MSNRVSLSCCGRRKCGHFSEQWVTVTRRRSFTPSFFPYLYSFYPVFTRKCAKLEAGKVFFSLLLIRRFTHFFPFFGRRKRKIQIREASEGREKKCIHPTLLHAKVEKIGTTISFFSSRTGDCKMKFGSLWHLKTSSALTLDPKHFQFRLIDKFGRDVDG